MIDRGSHPGSQERERACAVPISSGEGATSTQG